MRKKLQPSIAITVKISLEEGERLRKVVLRHFGGNVSAAIREAIDLLLKKYE